MGVEVDIFARDVREFFSNPLAGPVLIRLQMAG